MILTHLSQTAAELRINNTPPVFVFDARGMDNVKMDSVNGWSVNVPFVDDEIRVSVLTERKYDLRVAFHIVSEQQQTAEYYQAKFDLLAQAQRSFVLALDKIKDTEGRSLVAVRDVPIKTQYHSVRNDFDVATTAILFNLPLTLYNYDSIC